MSGLEISDSRFEKELVAIWAILNHERSSRRGPVRPRLNLFRDIPKKKRGSCAGATEKANWVGWETFGMNLVTKEKPS